MPGGVINTGTHPKALWPGVHAWWGLTYNQHAVEYTDLYDVKDSDQAYEEDVGATGFGLAAEKPEGGPVTYDGETQGYIQRYTHFAYALGYKVTYEERRDNKYEQVSMGRAASNAFSIQQTVENLAIALYNNAFNTTVFVHADGQPLISPNHPNVTGGTYSNQLTPGADFQESSLEDVAIQLMGFKNDRGLNISVMPRSLIVPRQMYFNAKRVMTATMQPDTMNNNPNVLRAEGIFPGGVKMNHYLDNPKQWFVRTNVQYGMTMFWRDRPFFDQDNDFDTKNAKAYTYFRCSFGATDPKGIIGIQAP